MGFMEKVAATIATKYGRVIGGQYEGTTIALGNEPNKKIQTSNQFSQIIFLDGAEERARFDIEDDIKFLVIDGETENGLLVVGKLITDETIALEVQYKKEMPKAMKFASMLGSALNEGKIVGTSQSDEEKYHNIKVFMCSVVGKLVPDSLKFLLDLYQKHNVLDEGNEQIIKFCLSKYE